MKKTILAKAQGNKNSPVMRYMLIAALVILLGFSIAYVYGIQRSTKEKFDNSPVFSVTYIFSPTCPHCIKFSPVFDKWTEANSSSFDVNRYDRASEQGKVFVQQYGISAYPTTLITKADGTLVKSQAGSFPDVGTFDSWIQSATM